MLAFMEDLLQQVRDAERGELIDGYPHFYYIQLYREIEKMNNQIIYIYKQIPNSKVINTQFQENTMWNND